MTTPRPLNRDDAKQSPETTFASPIDIVSEPLLTRGEKLATLERWRQTVFEQLKASGEGTPPNTTMTELRVAPTYQLSIVWLASGSTLWDNTQCRAVSISRQ
jgi:hypothetical protein